MHNKFQFLPSFIKRLAIIIWVPFLFISCSSGPSESTISTLTPKPGAYDIHSYATLLKGKKVGLLVNQTSVINNTHLLDTLLQLDVDVKKIYTPEHGFRGTADAGEKVNNNIDQKTGIPIISLYGKHRKPKHKDLKGIDVVVFDLQDVGVRFYTYISTLHYMMETCAELNIPLILLDRPNPNGFYVSGPVLDTSFSSFIGMHPVPIVYGLSIGEYGQMINGEKWLKDEMTCDLKVIKCQDYNHKMSYDLPIKPSPNLPNQRSILLYPNLCMFEGTHISIGRGTRQQFQVIGHPDAEDVYPDFSFTPSPQSGAKKPKLKGKKCYGEDFSQLSIDSLMKEPAFSINQLVNWYKILDKDTSFWRKDKFIDKLAGTDQLRMMIDYGIAPNKIEASWEEELNEYKRIREKYLLYDDFE